jgi:bifunctional isochorismate lyase/aryl carrier protein
MGIASIEPYPMPGEADLPPAKVSWQLHADRAALLVHDMQRYFVDFLPANASPTQELLSNTASLRQMAARSGVPVFYSAQPGSMTPEQRGLLADFWGPGMDGDPSQREIVPTMPLNPSDVMITKWRYSAFARTDLLDQLRQAGRDQLIICGIYAHIGCVSTANEAMAHDVQPFLVADAVADFSAEYHRLALSYAAERCAAVRTTREVLQCMERSPATARA